MEENTNNELTFAKIWNHIKKSGVRIIVYAVVALIVCGGLLGICDIFVSQSQYEVSVTYYYSGAENGEAPWGGQANITAEITSASNISSALDKLEYSDEEKDKLVRLIIRNLSVVNTFTNEIKDEETEEVLSGTYTYKVVLSQNSQIDKIIKSRNAYNNIVSAVLTNYMENFKTKYSFDASKFDVLNAPASYNAFQKYYIMKGNIDVFVKMSNTCAEKAPDFVSESQKMSFGTLQSRIESVVLPKLEAYCDFVSTNGMNGNKEYDYVNNMLLSAENEVARCAKAVEDYQQKLASLMVNGTVTPPSTTGTTIYNPPSDAILTTAMNELSNAISERDIAEANKSFWERCKSNYESAEDYASKTDEQKQALIDSANALESEVISEYNSLVNACKQMIEEYNSGYSVNSLVRMTSVPTQATNSPITLKVGLIVELMVLLIAIAVAMIVTGKKGAMKLKKKVQESQAEEVVSQNAEEQDASEQKADDVESQDSSNL